MRSIHENRTLEEGFEIWANCAAVRGLLDASRIATALGNEELAEEWKARSGGLLQAITERLYDRDCGIFIKNLRSDGTRISAPDISQLSPFYFGLLSNPTTSRDSLSLLTR